MEVATKFVGIGQEITSSNILDIMWRAYKFGFESYPKLKGHPHAREMKFAILKKSIFS